MTTDVVESPDRREIVTFELDQRLALGFRFPVRMTALPIPSGGVALVSPIRIDSETAAALAVLGEVRYLIAPNLLHHLYLADVSKRYPNAEVLAPAGLAKKRPDLRIDRTLEDGLPEPLGMDVEAFRIEGAPSIDEFVFFHRPSRTLIVTDLVFHIEKPRGFMAHAVLTLVGCRGRLAQSRAWYGFSTDRAATVSSLEAIVNLGFDTLVVAHGEIVRDRARERFRGALRLVDPPRNRLSPGDPQRP